MPDDQLPQDFGVSPEYPTVISATNRWRRGGKTVTPRRGGVMLAVVTVGYHLAIAFRDAREAARRSQCKGNLKQIGLALLNYHDTFGCFPPAYIADADGKPMHSWRVLILPYIDNAQLYNQSSLRRIVGWSE